jgi:Tol biopolymer transport system component
VDGAIYVMSADATGLRRLSPELPKGVFDQDPSWSPDGSQIAFERWTNEDVAASAEDGDIWIIDADGTDATRVTHGSGHWFVALLRIREAGMTGRRRLQRAPRLAGW